MKDFREKYESVMKKIQDLYKPFDDEIERLNYEIEDLRNKKDKLGKKIDECIKKFRPAEARKYNKELSALVTDINERVEDLEFFKEQKNKNSELIRKIKLIEDTELEKLRIEGLRINEKFNAEYKEIEDKYKKLKDEEHKKHLMEYKDAFDVINKMREY